MKPLVFYILPLGIEEAFKRHMKPHPLFKIVATRKKGGRVIEPSFEIELVFSYFV